MAGNTRTKLLQNTEPEKMAAQRYQLPDLDEFETIDTIAVGQLFQSVVEKRYG